MVYGSQRYEIANYCKMLLNTLGHWSDGKNVFIIWPIPQ